MGRTEGSGFSLEAPRAAGALIMLVTWASSELELPAERRKGEQDKPARHTRSICGEITQVTPSLFYTA